MKDRVPLYPGRVKLVPVSGQENVYDMTRADQPTQQGDPLNKATLLKDATAALYGLGTGAVPNDLFNILSASALYKTVAHTAQLGTLSEGTIIYLNENGSPVPFYVAKQGYEPSYNTSRVLVVRKDAAGSGKWNSNGVNTYNGSTIDTWMNGEYLDRFGENIKAAISKTTIQYRIGNGNNSVSTIQKSVFPLSQTEYGKSGYGPLGTAVPIASTITNNIEENTWARSVGGRALAGVVTKSTSVGIDVTQTALYQPAFTLPSSFIAYTEPPDTGLYDISDNLLLKLPGVQIVTGSYVGTGKYGSSNPNSLTFDFTPQVIFMDVRTANDYNSIPQYYIMFRGAPYTFTPGASSRNVLSWTNNGVSWYSRESGSDADYSQFNATNKTYYYIAIG